MKIQIESIEMPANLFNLELLNVESSPNGFYDLTLEGNRENIEQYMLEYGYDLEDLDIYIID